MARSNVAVAALVIGLLIGASGAWLYAKRPSAAIEPVKTTERKILFYRNPMNPQVTSPTPQKDSMGMDYVPVYEDEAQTEAAGAPGTVRISFERMQRIGVKSQEVKRKDLTRLIRTVGRVEPVENKVYLITAKVSGWVEKLHVNRTDQMVRKGDALMELYSPDLVAAQEEYLIAWRALERAQKSGFDDVKSGAAMLVRAARERLKYWDISDDQIERLKNAGVITRTMTMRAASSGSVTEKMIVEGQKIEAGEPLFKIIDHSSVWVYGEIYEYEIPYIKLGQTASLYPAYSSNEAYKGRIEHIYSHLGSIRYAPEEGTEVRTAKVRFALPNAGHNLKLGMYLNVEISIKVANKAVAVPDSAVIDSGTRQVVIIDKRDGTFEPREVRVGAKADGFYEILKGVSENDWVVTSANFLIDSESNLKAAVGSLGHAHEAKKEEAKEEKSEPAEKPNQAGREAQGPQAGHEGH